MIAARPQIGAGDAADPETLRRSLNDIFLEFSKRLEALEATKGLVEFNVSFETGGVVTPGTAPFTADGAGVRMSCPFTPTGLVLLRLEQVMPAGQIVLATASDVKWHFAAGPRAAEGALHIDFVTGLQLNARFNMRVGVTRG